MAGGDLDLMSYHETKQFLLNLQVAFNYSSYRDMVMLF